MINVISLLISIIITIFLINLFIKEYKKTKSLIEKILYILLLIVYFMIVTIYYLDKYNVPTMLNYTKNINTERWFNFISSYSSAIVGAIISGIFLIIVTYKQIQNENIRRNEELAEQRRVNNIPILKCDITFNDDYKYNHIVILSATENNSKSLCLISFKIENIGLNVARNITCSIKNEDSKFETYSIPNDGNYILKVGSIETYGLMVGLDLKKEKAKKIIVTFYYDDLFNNHYAQDIELSVEFSPVTADKTISRGIDYKITSFKDIVIKKERLIKEK